MAYKRLVAVVAVDNLRVVKTYGFSERRPAGAISSLLTELDSWAVDEIAILDVSRRGKIGSDLLKTISRLALRTPLTYGGGIREISDIRALLDSGVDRFLVETLFFECPEKLDSITSLVGSQALLLSLPLLRENVNDLYYFPAPSPENSNPVPKPFSQVIGRIRESPVSEIFVIDRKAEGYPGKFGIIQGEGESPLKQLGKNIVWFGGISFAMVPRLAALEETTGIAFGRQLLESEAVLPNARERILRNPSHSIFFRTS